MLISEKKKFVFIHIQKTAGTSLRKYFFENIDDIRDHLRPHSPLMELEEKYMGFYKTAFVRNPFDRLVSWYFMIKSNSGKKNFLQRNVLEKAHSFSEFVLFCEEIENASGWKPFKYNQIDYLTDKNGNLAMDFIGKFENLSDDLKVIANQINIKKDMLSIPHLNESKHKYYRSYYTEETRRIIEKRFMRDLEYFKYSF